LPYQTHREVAVPIYEYRCSSCGHQQEYIQKVSDPILTTCPACARETYAKMLTAAGFQLKGSGWYATDFKNSGTKPAPKPVEKTDKPAADKPAATPGSDAKAAAPCGAACACS